MSLESEKMFAKVNKVSYIEDIKNSTGLPEEFIDLAYKIIVEDETTQKTDKAKRVYISRQI